MDTKIKVNYACTGKKNSKLTDSNISHSLTALNCSKDFYNSVPLDATVCESHYDTKMYSTVLLIALCIAIPPLLFFAAYSFFSAENEYATSISKFEKQRDKKAGIEISRERL